MSDRNPVALMDSVDAMDLMHQARIRLTLKGDDPAFLDKLYKCEHEHKRALRKHIDGEIKRTDDPEPEKRLTRRHQTGKVFTRRSK